MVLSCPKVQLTETFLPTILLNVSDYSHTEKGGINLTQGLAPGHFPA